MGKGWVALLLILIRMSMCFCAVAEIQVHLQPGDGTEGFVMEVISVKKPRQVYRVYLYHTHTYEAYTMAGEDLYEATETWRTADENYNMIRIGRELKQALETSGVEVTHDTTAYEPPRLSTAYARSLAGLEKAAETEYDLYIDLHRDAYSQGNGPNTVQRNGEQTARLLFLVGRGDSFDGDEKPDWQRNRQAAQWISDQMNGELSGISRGVALKSGRYNQHAASPCMLIEVGNNQNTLAEALAAVPYLAQGICSYFDNQQLQDE